MRHAPKKTRTPVIQDMAALLKRSGLLLNQHQLEQLWRYHNLIRRRNQGNELTRIIGFESMVIKHYVDSMIVGQFLTLPSPLIDIGTGAGFPGIPLKIRYPHLKLILAEPRPKRVAFLGEVCRELSLKQVQIFDHKVVSRSFTRSVKGVITRAVETMDKTMLRTTACLEKNGILIFLKGPAVDPEIAEINRRFKDRYRLILDKPYSLPQTPHQRRLIVFQKMEAPPPLSPKESPNDETEGPFD